MPSRAERILSFLTQKLQAYDPSIDTTDGSSFQRTVLAPLSTFLGPDLASTDAEAFLRARLRQEFPSLNVEAGSGAADILLRPLQLLLEPIHEELALLERAGSLASPSMLSDGDVDALADNWMVARRLGTYAAGSVRIYLRAATHYAVPLSARFYAGDLEFVPTTPQTFQAQTVLSNREAGQYYVDVAVRAAEPGAKYSVGAQSISRATGVSYTRITNPYAMSQASDRETNDELLARVRQSMTERSLTTRRGIRAALYAQYPALRDIEVVGFGDAEMQRDVVTIDAPGTTRVAGFCFLFGPYALFFSQYEDRGSEGTTGVRAGDTLRANYWGFLYDGAASDRNEDIKVRSVIFDSREVIRNLPSVLILELERASSRGGSMLGLLPGVLPFVFGTISGPVSVFVGDLPGGVRFPEDTLDPNAIHLGGHYDVYARTTTVVEQVASVPLSPTDYVLEGFGLRTDGAGDVPHAVTADTILVFKLSTGSVAAGYTASVGASVSGVITSYTNLSGGRVKAMLTSCVGTFRPNDAVSFLTGTTTHGTGVVESFSPQFTESEVTPGMCLQIMQGADAGVYRILACDAGTLYLASELSSTESELRFRVLREVRVDAVSPKTMRIPYGSESATGLQTYIGSKIVQLPVIPGEYGVLEGDTFEILTGDDAGTYSIAAIWPNAGQLTLSAVMTTTNSDAEYRIYESSAGLQLPMRRIIPQGVRLLDSGGGATGYTVPYALPLGGRAQGSFSGAKDITSGLNGFILPDPGPVWEPNGNVVPNGASEDQRTCFSDECLDYDGYLACATLLSDGTFYLSVDVDGDVAAFYTTLRTWLQDAVIAFGLGTDMEAFVNGVSPITLGDPHTGLSLTGLTGPFSIGHTAQGVTSAATAQITAVFSKLVISVVSGTFEDQELVTGAISGSGIATIVGASALSVASSGSVFVSSDTITGATSGATATITSVVVVVHVENTVGTFQEGESVEDTTSGFTGTLGSRILPLIQYEIVIPSHFFDGISNTFVALPEFDWEAILGSIGSLTEALGAFRSGALNGARPALAAARAMDVLELTSGPNMGRYLIERVDNYALCTLSAISGNRVDLSHAYTVSAVRIFGSFPVDTVGDIQSLFAAGVPDLSALPAAPRFPGVSYNALGITQSPWEWVGLALNWVLRFLTSMGFDLPTSITLDPSNVLKALWSSFFTRYAVSRASAPQLVRLYFQEPTRFAAFAPPVVARFDKQTFAYAPASITGVRITVPIPDYGDMAISLALVDRAGPRLLSGTLGSAAGTATTVAALAAEIQSALDAEASYILVTGTDASSGALTITTVDSGAHCSLLMSEGAHALGFELGGARAATLESEIAPLFEDCMVFRLALNPSNPAGFRISINDGAIISPTTQTYSVEIASGLPSAGYFTYERLLQEIEEDISNIVAANYPSATVSVFFDTEEHGASPATTQPRLLIQMEDAHAKLVSVSAAVVGDDLSTELFGATSVAAVVDGTASSITGAEVRGTWAFHATVIDSNEDAHNLTLDDYSEVIAFPDAYVDMYAFIVALNATQSLFDGETRQLWFYETADHKMGLRTTTGGSVVSISITVDDEAFGALGFVSDSAEGSAAPGTNIGSGDTTIASVSRELIWEGKQTRLVAGPGGVQVDLLPSPEAEGRIVLPRGAQGVADYPRDLWIQEAIDGSTGTIAWASSDTAEGFFLSGVRPGVDELLIYPKRELLSQLRNSILPLRATDRICAVATVAGSPVVRLPAGVRVASFYAAEGRAPADGVVVGDILFIEEGADAGCYTVVGRGEYALTLDRVLTRSTSRIYSSGTLAEYVPGSPPTVVCAASTFSSADVGRYLTLWGSELSGLDGSYAISAVSGDGSTATIETAVFEYGADQLLWAVVGAPDDAVGSSSVGGGTALVGVVPFRIYSGTPEVWSIVDVEPSHASQSKITIAYRDIQRPTRGYMQPYAVRRSRVQEWSPDEMSQNTEGSMYYVDVLANTLGPASSANLAAHERVEPVFGTYESDGYWLDTNDTRTSFSDRESLFLNTSLYFTPLGSTQEYALCGQILSITYEYDPMIAQAGAFLASDDARNVCAYPLARGMLPCFVSTEMTFSSGKSSDILNEIVRTYIDGLSAGDVLSAQSIQQLLIQAGSGELGLAAELQLVTHDRSRRQVISWVTSSTLDDPTDFDGSPRLRFFVADTILLSRVVRDTGLR